MNTHRLPAILWVSAAALAGWVGIASAEGFPQNSYACQVATSTGIPAVVLVQANDVTEAVAVAQRNKAITFDRVSVRPATVVQCILPPDEKFNDASFQQKFDKLEL
jgi:hypothetical protein